MSGIRRRSGDRGRAAAEGARRGRRRIPARERAVHRRGPRDGERRGRHRARATGRPRESTRSPSTASAVQLDPGKRYVMLNKPTGVVSSLKDEKGRPDLREFTARYEERLFNVGRLDADTSGLLLLTNDGDIAHVLAHPSFGVHEDLYRDGQRGRDPGHPAHAGAGHRAGGRADRRRPRPHRRGGVEGPHDRRDHPALRSQPHRAAHAGGRRPPGARARAAPVRPAAPRDPRHRARRATSLRWNSANC